MFLILSLLFTMYIVYFFTAIWLPHGQLWTILKDNLTNPVLITALLTISPGAS